MIRARRLLERPIVHQGMSASLGDNINGPSLVHRPAWSDGPGRYLLYFAHHKGRFIRMAHADRPEGPWTVHEKGVLDLGQTPLPTERPDVPQPEWAQRFATDGLYPHIASPDVHLREDSQRFEMILHGLWRTGEQVSLRAWSGDGLAWEVETSIVAWQTYLRVFSHDGWRYALARGGEVLREDETGVFHGAGVQALPSRHRHPCVLVRGDTAHVLSSRIGDAPETILHATVDLRPHWTHWRAEGSESVLRPERAWEGAEAPLSASFIGAAEGLENGLRDPFLFEDGSRVLMVYAGGGEHALGLAEVEGL